MQLQVKTRAASTSNCTNIDIEFFFKKISVICCKHILSLFVFTVSFWLSWYISPFICIYDDCLLVIDNTPVCFVWDGKLYCAT
jgi:hypothetical protein